MSSFDLPTDPADPRIPRLLALARTPRLRLLDVLLDDLRSAPAGSAARLEELLAPWNGGGVGAPRALLEPEGATLADLVALKERSKAALGAAQGSPAASLAGYFCASAAALAFHGTVICSRSRAELDAALLDLAEASGEPWAALFRRAAAVPDPSDPIFPGKTTPGPAPEPV